MPGGNTQQQPKRSTTPPMIKSSLLEPAFFFSLVSPPTSSLPPRLARSSSPPPAGTGTLAPHSLHLMALPAASSGTLYAVSHAGHLTEVGITGDSPAPGRCGSEC